MKGIVKSADRTLDLLELLSATGGSMSHLAMATSLGIPKSSLTQLLRNLVSRGYLEASIDSRFYALGPALANLAIQATGQRNVEAVAQPVLEELSRRTGESTALNVLEGNNIRLVCAVTSTQRLVSHMKKGDRAPLYATSSGKIMLAYMTKARLGDYFASVDLVKITENTITSPNRLRAQLSRIRQARIADVFEEYTPGIVGLAAPILSRSNRLIGAINVALPAMRYDERTREKITHYLKAAVGSVENQLSASDKIPAKVIVSRDRQRGGISTAD